MNPKEFNNSRNNSGKKRKIDQSAEGSSNSSGDEEGSSPEPSETHENSQKVGQVPEFHDESRQVEAEEKKGSTSGGRRKINIEFIENKSRRHVTFSKRKAGLIKKAYELSTLTGTQVLLLIASETGNVYTFATPKLQPLITKPEGKSLIQACLNPSDVPPSTQPNGPQQGGPSQQGTQQAGVAVNQQREGGGNGNGVQGMGSYEGSRKEQQRVVSNPPLNQIPHSMTNPKVNNANNHEIAFHNESAPPPLYPNSHHPSGGPSVYHYQTYARPHYNALPSYPPYYQTHPSSSSYPNHQDSSEPDQD